MAYLPGEKMHLELVQKGQDSHQGVGYLPDGTMVVVEHASSQIGQSVEVEFIRSLQTAAGKMMFAKKVDASEKKKCDSTEATVETKATKGNRDKAGSKACKAVSSPEQWPAPATPITK